MKIKITFFLGLFFSVLTLPGFAQQQIKIEDVSKHVGDSVKICSKIYGGKFLEASKGTPTILNMGGNYPNAPLTLVIGNDARQQFKKAPEVEFRGADVCVTGRIQIFKGKPEMIINNASQIQDAIIDKTQDTGEPK